MSDPCRWWARNLSNGWSVVDTDNNLIAFVGRDDTESGDPVEEHTRLLAAAPALLDGCNALLGLIQLVSGRDDMPTAIREALTTSHRVAEAKAAIARATTTGAESVELGSRRVLLLASYCGDDNPGCSGTAPCPICLGMSNVFRLEEGAKGTFVKAGDA